MPIVLAHQGGWDEALVVLVPIALVVGLFWLAGRRARSAASRRAAHGAAPAGSSRPAGADRVERAPDRDDPPARP
jgi:hypothetical protein